MNHSDPARKRRQTEADLKRLAALDDDEKTWARLADEEFMQLFAVRFLEYGSSQDPAMISALFALYRHAMGRLDVDERLQLLMNFSELIEEHDGFGHMGLMVFLTAEDDPGIRSSAALNLSVLYDCRGGDELDGPRFVISTLVNYDAGAVGQGSALGGVLLLGDKRIMPLLAGVWDGLSEEAQLEMTGAKSGVITEGVIEFWLDRLEQGCSENVFGSAAAAIAKMPVISHLPFVADVERLLPAYAGGEPLITLRRTPFSDYLEQIRPRLDALAAAESEPRVIPMIAEMWENPEAFQGIAN